MYYDERENNLNYLDSDNNNYIKFDNKTNNIDMKLEKEDYILKNNKLYGIENVTVNNYRKNDQIANVEEGFNRGNMFLNEYMPYKKHLYKVLVKDERDKMLLRVQELTFALKDLGLYLDVNPTNMETFKEFKNINDELLMSKNEYEKKYGPLCLEENYMFNNYEWVNNPWPWMNEGRHD